LIIDPLLHCIQYLHHKQYAFSISPAKNKTVLFFKLGLYRRMIIYSTGRGPPFWCRLILIPSADTAKNALPPSALSKSYYAIIPC
jgi:hypothetical protein